MIRKRGKAPAGNLTHINLPPGSNCFDVGWQKRRNDPVWDGRKQERNMALLRRELHRDVKGPEVTWEDRWVLVFDTDTKRQYVEHQSRTRTDRKSTRLNSSHPSISYA